MHRVVITGMGAVTPFGTGVKSLWDGIVENRLAITPIDTFDASPLSVHFAGQVHDFDPSGCLDKKDARTMERFTQFAVVSALEALRDSGYDIAAADPYRAGCIFGVGVGGIGLTEQEYSHFRDGGVSKISARYVPMMIANMAAGTVAMKTGFKGANFATVTACASSTHAIGEAFRKIKDGYLDCCLCGGSESALTTFTLAGFQNMRALTKTTELSKASIPFDKERSGFVIGEGAGALMLESYESAVARGAKIYAEVCGYGATCDAYHQTAPAPDGAAAAAAMRMAYEEGGLGAEDIDYINAHGTSTGLNDASETAAIKAAFGEHAYKLKVNSTKSMIGHLLGGAGAVEAIVTAKSVETGLIHRTVGYTTPDPECDLDYCGSGNVTGTVRAALTNNLGFGGHNACLCIRQA